MIYSRSSKNKFLSGLEKEFGVCLKIMMTSYQHSPSHYEDMMEVIPGKTVFLLKPSAVSDLETFPAGLIIMMSARTVMRITVKMITNQSGMTNQVGRMTSDTTTAGTNVMMNQRTGQPLLNRRLICVHGRTLPVSVTTNLLTQRRIFNGTFTVMITVTSRGRRRSERASRRPSPATRNTPSMKRTGTTKLRQPNLSRCGTHGLQTEMRTGRHRPMAWQDLCPLAEDHPIKTQANQEVFAVKACFHRKFHPEILHLDGLTSE